MATKKKKFYAVAEGRKRGIFATWNDCKKSVDGYSGAVYKSFPTKADAEAWLAQRGFRVKGSKKSFEELIAPIRKKTEVKLAHTEVIAYTDGSCLSNPDGPGGWAAVLENMKTGKVLEISGGDHSTTNNRMELTAIISALARCPDKSVTIYTDSQYAKNGIESWMDNWKARGWKTSSGSQVKNIDLWIQLDAMMDGRHDIRFAWVKGHAGIDRNERCDQLAKSQAMKYR